MNLDWTCNRNLLRDHCVHRVVLRGSLDAAEDWLVTRPGDFYTEIETIRDAQGRPDWLRVAWLSDADVAFELKLAFG